jgi:hypothetical protein
VPLPVGGACIRARAGDCAPRIRSARPTGRLQASLTCDCRRPTRWHAPWGGAWDCRHLPPAVYLVGSEPPFWNMGLVRRRLPAGERLWSCSVRRLAPSRTWREARPIAAGIISSMPTPPLPRWPDVDFTLSEIREFGVCRLFFLQGLIEERTNFVHAKLVGPGLQRAVT